MGVRGAGTGGADLQLEKFSERSVAFSDRIAKVPIFLAMTVYKLKL